MNTPTTSSRIYDFSFPELDTLVRVEEADGAVVIRTTRDTFSEERKARFVHELAAEGFIPDEISWLPSAAPGTSGGVCWLVDHTCFMPGPEFAARTRRFMVRLLGASALLWLLVVGLAFLSHAG